MGMAQLAEMGQTFFFNQKIYSQPFFPKARRFQCIYFVAKGSQQIATASPLDASYLR